jgi:hypothetical protein
MPGAVELVFVVVLLTEKAQEEENRQGEDSEVERARVDLHQDETSRVRRHSDEASIHTVNNRQTATNEVREHLLKASSRV